MILAIETATGVCSVALFTETALVALLESKEPNAHSRTLHVMIDRLLTDAGITVAQLDAVVVSKGPGSYTGLRIGVSTAKGLCYARNLPMIAVNTLESMAYGMRAAALAGGTPQDKAAPATTGQSLFIPMIDAKRMEVYSAVYDAELAVVKETSAEIITADSLAAFKDYPHIYVAGDGAAKCKELLQQQENITFPDGFEASARFLMEPALCAWNAKQFENVAYFEPFYLKDFIAGKPRVKGLN